MSTGDRVYNTTTNHTGTIVAGPYVADNAMYQVADVRWDAPVGTISTVDTRHLRIAAR